MIRLLTGSSENITEYWHESVTVDCQQKERCIEIARICADNDPHKRPTTTDIICQLTQTETTNQNVAPVTITEPRYDQTSTLYKNVNIFLAWRPESHEHNRGLEKLPVERPKWKLAFNVPPKFPIITGEPIWDANGSSLEVILVDTDTGEPSSDLPEDALLIELIPLLSNFPRDRWDADDFQRGIVERNHPILAGECRPIMWDGRATVNELMFTDSYLSYGCMFRIGVRVVPDSYHGVRILEGMTTAFMLRSRRGYNLPHIEHYMWELAFQSQPRNPIYVGHQIRDVIGNQLEVIIVDTETGLPSELPVMELQIELQVSFSAGRRSIYWLADDESQPGTEPYLSGDVRLTMKDDGRVTVNDLQQTGNPKLCSSITVRVVPGSYNGPGTIREGSTHMLKIKDSRHAENTKRFPPGLGDEVWRLEGISWGGVFHKRLAQKNVRNVQDFLTMLAVKPDELRAILGDGMDEITRHARTCNFPRDKVYAYSAAHATIYVNTIFDLIMVELGGVECLLHQLDEARKRVVQQMVQEAYEHRHSLEEVKLTWKLAFKSQPRLPIDTGSRIVDATGNPLEVILVDAKTGSPSSYFSSRELFIGLVPLLGDFPPYQDWSAEEFRMAIVKERQKDVPLLMEAFDNGPIIMRNGSVTLPEELHFTDDSSWVICRKFRIGAYVMGLGNEDGFFRIVEAMTEAFEVGDLNQKHYPPFLSDPVWRLEMMDKEGEAHRRLMSNNVDTVQEFLRMLHVKPDELRAILGDPTTDRMYITTSHAEDCHPGVKVYAYNRANSTIYIDSVFLRLLKLEIDGMECRLDGLSDIAPDKAAVAQMMIARQLILEAYEHRHNLQEVDEAMERCVCYVEVLLFSGAKHQDQLAHLDDEDDDHAQPLVHDEEVPVPQTANQLVHQIPSQQDTTSGS